MTKFAKQLQAHREKARNSPETYEAGEIGHEMGKQYMKDLLDMIQKHKNISGKFYILVAYENNFLMPEAQKIVMCSMRKPKPPFPGTDFFSYDNDTGDLELLWTLPDNTTWDMLKSFPNTDKQLLKFMSDFESGALDAKYQTLKADYERSPYRLDSSKRAV